MDSKLLLDGEKLKQLRQIQGLSQEGLVYACELRRLTVSIATVKRAEAGKRVSLRTARNLASFFDIDISDVTLSADDDKNKSADDTLNLCGSSAVSHSILPILWLRFDSWDITEELTQDVIKLLQRSGSLWQEALGNTILATFGHQTINNKGHLHAQLVALEIQRFLLDRDLPIHFYAALQLGPVQQNLEETIIDPPVLQWFAQHSTYIPCDSIIVSTDLYKISDTHFNYRTSHESEQRLWVLHSEKHLQQTLPLIGRSTELLQLSGLLDGVKRRNCPAITHIHGQAGIGKSRLINAIHEQAYLQEILVADIDLEAGWNDPLHQLTAGLCQNLFIQAKKRWPEKKILSLLFNQEIPANQQIFFVQLLDLSTKVINSKEHWQNAQPINEDEILAAMAQMFTIFLGWQVHSLLITVDNLHLANYKGCQLLGKLLTLCKHLPISCIITSRTEYQNQITLEPFINDYCHFSTIPLGPLSEAEVERLCHEFNHLPKSYIHRCIQWSGGIPLYLIQLLTSQPEDSEAIPSSLQLLVEQKLLQLEEKDRRVLELLSICEAPLPLSVVKDLLKHKDYSPEGLVSAQLVKIDIHLSISLCHKLVQHIVRERLPDDIKRKYHQAVADYLEKRLDKMPQLDVYSLAHHFEQAGHLLKGAKYHSLAATSLLQKGLYNESERILNKALQLAKSCSEKDVSDIEIDIQLALSSIYKVKYGWVSPLLKSSYLRIEELCKQKEADKRLAMALFGLWTIEISTLNMAAAEELANRCLEVSLILNDDQGCIHAYTALANTLFWRGKHKQAESAASHALRLYKPEYTKISIQLMGQDPRALAGCFAIWSASILEHGEKAEQFRNDLMREMRDLKHDFSLSIALQGSAWLDYHHNKPAKSLAAAQELEALSISMNFPFYRGVAALFSGWAKHKLDKDPQAASIVDRGYRQWLASSGDKIAYSLYSTILAEIYLETNKTKEAVEVLHKGITFGIEHGEECYVPEMFRLLALCSEATEAHQYLQEGLLYCQESPLFAARIRKAMGEEESFNQSFME